jgi:hypothetical protein
MNLLAAPAELRRKRGLRRGEAAGLRWADLDLDAGTLTVTGQLQQLGGRLVPLGAAQAQTAGKAPAAAHGNDPVISRFIKQVGATAIRNQNTLSLFRGWMLTQPGFARSGYVGSIDDLARKATTIMWHGPRTHLLMAIIREGARRGIAVHIQHRRYSLQQINAATAAIWKQAAAGKWAGFKVAAIAGISATHDGITVEGTYTAVPPGRRAPQVRSLATVVRGVPVRIQPSHAFTKLSGRDADTAPFNAGGLMVGYYTGAVCSSGFAIVINGVDHTTTARHCNDGNAAGDYVDANDATAPSPPPTSQWYGKYLENSGNGGAMVMGNTGFYWMFNHGWNSTTYSTVIGYENLGLNDLVCTEGGNSGEHCNVKVIDLSVSYNDGDGSFLTIEGQQTDGTIAAMEGDSGGPVMSLNNTSSGQVRAAGMIQAGGDELTDCGASYFAAPCFSDVLFTSMVTIVNSISGASLRTG